MLPVQKIEIPQKLKDELIKNNLQIPDYKNFNISYDTNFSSRRFRNI